MTTHFEVSWPRNCSCVPRGNTQDLPAQCPWVGLEITEVGGGGDACAKAWDVWVWTGEMSHSRGTNERSKHLIRGEKRSR